MHLCTKIFLGPGSRVHGPGPRALKNLDSTQKVTETIEKVQNKAIRIIVSAPKKFSVTTGRSLLNLPTLQSRRLYLFHKFTHKKVAKNKASKHILNLVQKSNKHKRCLRSNCSIIKPSFRMNFGRSYPP